VYFTPFVNCTPQVPEANCDDVDSRQLYESPFKNNIPDPPLPARELRTLNFALEQSEGKIMGGSFGKEATVEQLPISKGVAAASTRLERYVAQGLHRHVTAAEWAFVLEGRSRTAVLDPPGGSEINEFDPGNVWHFPRGNPHSLACLREKACYFTPFSATVTFSSLGPLVSPTGRTTPQKHSWQRISGYPKRLSTGFPANRIAFC
jgi:oxalate decarboxylase